MENEMAEPFNEHKRSTHRPSNRWWVHLCRWLWKQWSWIWGTILLGIGLNVIATWLTSKNFDINGTPLGWMIQFPIATVLIGSSLFFLTTLTGVVSHLDKGK